MCCGQHGAQHIGSMLSYLEINEKEKKKTHRKPNQTMNVALLVWTSLVQLRKREKASMAGAKPARVTVGGGEGRVVMGR